MADKNQVPAASLPEDDGLLNLKFAQAEADLAQHTGGLGPTTNEYVSSDEDAEISEAEGPLDRQGQRRGQPDGSNDEGSAAGAHR